jgi:hypothetical protein
MAHPHQAHRQHKVEHSRVAHITRGYMSGGVVDSGSSVDRKLGKKSFAQRDGQAVEGGSVKERADRPGRARGGRSPKHKGTNVNVIVAPQGGAAHPGLAPAVGAGAPMASPPMVPPPHPPMMAPPGMPPGGPPGPMAGAPPPGMPIRHSGGRAYAKGGAVTDGPAFKDSLRAGTQVQNNPSGKNDQKSVGRGRVVTFRAGGAVKGRKYPIDSGSGGGEARLEKERLAKHSKNGMAP